MRTSSLRPGSDRCVGERKGYKGEQGNEDQVEAKR